MSIFPKRLTKDEARELINDIANEDLTAEPMFEWWKYDLPPPYGGMFNMPEVIDHDRKQGDWDGKQN